MAGGTPAYLKIAEILLHAHRSSKSGVVRLEQGSTKKQLVISSGAVAFAESNLPEDHLARILVRLEILEEKQLKQISSLIRAGRNSEQAIAEASGVDREQLLTGVREQVISILASTFCWKGCEIRFFAGDGLLSRTLRLQLPIPAVVLQAARRAAAEHLTDGTLPPLEGVLMTVTDSPLVTMLPLDKVELFAYAQLHKPCPASEAVHLLPTAENKPEELLYRLLLLGLLRRETDTGQQGAAAREENAFKVLAEHIEEMLLQFEISNYYQILSVPSDATEDQIHGAYHQLARKYHPDRFESKESAPSLRDKAERLFTYITGAYTTLSDPLLRAHYDETRATQEGALAASAQARTTSELEKEKMAEALYRAGCSSLAAGDMEKAAARLKESVWLLPEVARYRHYLGVVLAAAPKSRKEAEQHLLKALELDQSRIDTRLELGKLYLSVGLPKKAEAQFQEVLRWDPEHPSARRLLGECGGEQGDTRQGAGFLRRPFSR